MDGIQLVVPKIFEDDRGFFFESYHKNRYEQLGIHVPFVQDNAAFSKSGTIRGLHYQSFPGQAKLVSCELGKIWDVAVDIRFDSPTFGKWAAFELDDQSRHQLFIPAGFAHGYCVLSETAFVRYKVSTFYDPKTECAIRWNDPDLKIKWPVSQPILSQKDQNSPFFNEIFAC
ncbi:MAG TPA: dTDP-4-dehydrorhamnose 3,5-epimerase [Chlamydiales bacterium]|nr:dTDP-4-dehydrorhamnose 3,5-epimerase [Chlamydiales bacterium]